MEYFKLMPFGFQMLFVIGIATGAVALAFLVAGISDALEDWVRHLIYIYKYKHRFNKPPTAKCYCKDCDNWHPHSPQATEGVRWQHASWHTADNWFCWDAEPRDKERPICFDDERG